MVREIGAVSEMKAEKLTVGILAHVDAGKTTLAEGILYQTGCIRNRGRVDHGNAFLDTHILEKQRGITIFSKQAEMSLLQKKITLLDTPGHVDFSAEMERTLQVLDYAILVISGADGVQGHVQTLWKLLKRYQVPVFLFVNKMDQQGTDKEKLMEEITQKLSDRCIDFSIDEKEIGFQENLAVLQESILTKYLEEGALNKEDIADLINNRNVFPCFFGSALKMTGVEEFIEKLDFYTLLSEYPEEFAARIYKISRDEQGNRLTYLKITGGCLKVKMLLKYKELWEEKVNQIRIYSGSQYQLVEEAKAGSICVLTGLNQTFSGQVLGVEEKMVLPLLIPVLHYQLLFPKDKDAFTMFKNMKLLEEEIPELQVLWKEEVREIHIRVMGEVQIEILQNMIEERFHVKVEFGTGSILYKETIAEPVIGIGHFEPLRHYAEVHLCIQPGEIGSGIQIDSKCSEDELDRNWQRLILTHLEEKKHIGVLTGSELTDVKITLIAGKAHNKHTEGGDFRQATYRALRQGLMKANNILLEPVYEYQLEVPQEMIGRAMSDITKMCGEFLPPISEGESGILTGTAPASKMSGYQREVTVYTKGRGSLSYRLKGYESCHNGDEVIGDSGYDSARDTENSADSVFCAHGAGFVVKWDKVEDYAHIDIVETRKKALQKTQIYLSILTDSAESIEGVKSIEGIKSIEGAEGVESGDNRKVKDAEGIESGDNGKVKDVIHSRNSLARAEFLKDRVEASKSRDITQEEIEEIFERSYGISIKNRSTYQSVRRAVDNKPSEYRILDTTPKKTIIKEEYLLVDGYNIIFAWDELRDISAISLEGARNKLLDILCNYQGYVEKTVIVVFDAYKVKGNPGEVFKHHNIHVVYTKEAETADQYIEKTVHNIAKKYHVTVATSDALEQMIIWGQGAYRLSARGLLEEVERVCKESMDNFEHKNAIGRNFPFSNLNIEL